MMLNKIISLDEYIERLDVGEVKRTVYVILKDYLTFFNFDVVFFETRGIFIIHDKGKNDDESITSAISLPSFFKEIVDKELSKENNLAYILEACYFLRTILGYYFDKYDE